MADNFYLNFVPVLSIYYRDGYYTLETNQSSFYCLTLDDCPSTAVPDDNGGGELQLN